MCIYIYICMYICVCACILCVCGCVCVCVTESLPLDGVMLTWACNEPDSESAFRVRLLEKIRTNCRRVINYCIKGLWKWQVSTLRLSFSRRLSILCVCARTCVCARVCVCVCASSHGHIHTHTLTCAVWTEPTTLITLTHVIHSRLQNKNADVISIY